MSEDRRRAGQAAARRDQALRRWIAEEVHPFSAPVRAQLDRHGLGRRGVRTAEDLGRLPVTDLAELGDGRAWVLHPTAEGIRAAGRFELRARLLLADVVGRREEFRRRDVDVPYKPVCWTAAPSPGGPPLFVGATTTDLDRLATLGRRALAISGITASDRIVCATPAGGIGPLQLELGARDAGVVPLSSGPDLDPALVVAARPTVIAGTPHDLRRAVDAGVPEGVRLLLAQVGPGVDGGGLGALRRRSGRPVRLWWAPAGVRAAWPTCEADELHTWPEYEHLEAVDGNGRPASEGRLVWSAVGWRGSVWLRVALGPSGAVDRAPCRCGRTTPRIRRTARPAARRTGARA